MKHITFSIITPAYNAGSQLSKTIASISNQDCQNFEYIIQDGGSNDGTFELIEEIKKEKPWVKFCQQKDNGIYDAMNLAVDSALGEYIIFLGAGDLLYDSSVLSQVEKCISDNNAPDIIYGYVMTQKPEESDLVKYDNRLNFWYTLKFRPVCHQAIFAKASLFKEKKFDISYEVVADQDWMMSMVKAGKCIKYIDTPISVYMLDGMSSSPEGEKKGINEQRYIHKKYYPVRSLLWQTYNAIKKKVIGN